MPDFSALNDVSWSDPRVLFLLGAILAAILGALVFLALKLERKRLLATSKEEDAERLGRAFAGTGLGFWDWDIEKGVFSYDEDWFAANLGYKNPDEELGIDFVGALIHPADLAGKNEAIYEHMIGNTDSYSVEFRLRKKEGSWVWILSRGKVFERDEQGRALRFAGADSLIDQQKLAEQVLEVEKEVSVRFGEVYSPEGIFQTIAEGLASLPEFEFSAVFLRRDEGKPMERIFAGNLPQELDTIVTLEREVGHDKIYYYDESEMSSGDDSGQLRPLSVTELRIVRNGEVAGCVWGGSIGRSFAPSVVIEAIEQLEVQAQGALDRIESEGFYRAGQRNLNSLINSIDEMIFILDQEYGIIYINEVVGNDLGYDQIDLLGTSLLELVPKENRELTAENFSDLIAGSLPQCSAQLLKKGRDLLQAEVHITSGRWGEADAYFCVVRNSGRQDEATKALEMRDQRLRVASRALIELITASDMENGIRKAVELIASVFDADRICVSEKVTNGSPSDCVEMDQISCWSRDVTPSVNLMSTGSERSEINLAEWVQKLSNGEIVSVSRDNCSPMTEEYLNRLGIETLLLVPIHLRDVWWGVMGAEMWKDTRDWSAGDVSLLEIVGSGLAGLVETVRLQRDLIEANDETEKTNVELGEAIQHAQEMAEEASQANRSKTEFLANMSHEIRTPMNAILGFSELIEAEVTDPALLQFLRAIRSSGKTLLALINDLLDLSKIEAGKMSLQFEPISLQDLIQDMLNIFQVNCDDKGITLESDLDPNLPQQLVLDEARIRQIIFNLLGNAVKFTHKGKVELRVYCRGYSFGSNKVDLRLEVSDTGIGIEKDDQKNIFEPFEQSRGQKQKDYGGTGLGLSITSRLVKMMGGNLTLSSALGKGSSFVIDLPGIATLGSSQAPIRVNGDAGKGEGALSFAGRNVMVVDDNLLNRRVLAASLRSYGLEIREAVNGRECLEKVEEMKPDLILMDLLMPELSGEETTILLREQSQFNNLHIVACTALDLSKAREISNRANFDDILIKPVSQSALRRVLQRFIPSSEEERKKEFLNTNQENEVQPKESDNTLDPEKVGSLIAELEQSYLPEWEGLLKRLRIAPILRTSKQMAELGNAYDCRQVVTYAEELQHWISLFDVKRLKKSMETFPSLIDDLRKTFSNGQSIQ